MTAGNARRWAVRLISGAACVMALGCATNTDVSDLRRELEETKQLAMAARQEAATAASEARVANAEARSAAQQASTAAEEAQKLRHQLEEAVVGELVSVAAGRRPGAHALQAAGDPTRYVLGPVGLADQSRHGAFPTCPARGRNLRRAL